VKLPSPRAFAGSVRDQVSGRSVIAPAVFCGAVMLAPGREHVTFLNWTYDECNVEYRPLVRIRMRGLFGAGSFQLK
jgi:hypothetical protein